MRWDMEIFWYLGPLWILVGIPIIDTLVASDFIPVMLFEWRSLDATQQQDVRALKDAYEGVWMPVLRALHRAGRLKARPEVARLFIFGALNWSVQWFSDRGALSLDDLTAQALLLFTEQA